MKLRRGVFLTDIHLPDNIPLGPIFAFLKDFKPDIVILGGDIVDAKGLHGVMQMRADQIDRAFYERDVGLLWKFLSDIHKAAPKSEVVYLEGNHEERYRRATQQFPNTFKGKAHMRLYPDAIPEGMKVKWIPYGTYESFYRLGDTVFAHGTIYPEHHARRYALDHLPYKCVYGHLHDFQSFTVRKSWDTLPARFAVTPGCLTRLSPEYKKGVSHKWVNGFLSFSFDGEVVIPTIYLIEQGRFSVGAKVYS